MAFYDVEYPFGQFWSPVPPMLPPSLGEHEKMREQKVLDFRKAGLSKNQNINTLFTPFSSKAQHYNSY